MGLLVSDTVLIDPTFEDTARWQASLTEYAYATDLPYDGYEYESSESSR